MASFSRCGRRHARRGRRCNYGFPVETGPFKPGDRVTVELDLPRAFVDAEGASVHIGVGAEESGYYPTQNLILPKKP